MSVPRDERRFGESSPGSNPLERSPVDRIAIEHPTHCAAEVGWVADVVFRERFGLEIETVVGTSGRGICIRRGDRKLTLSAEFFENADRAWGSAETATEVQSGEWDVAAEGLGEGLLHRTVPIPFGRPGISIDECGDVAVRADLLGTIFFHLSRYEEFCRPDRDQHGRFPGKASYAARLGMLDRPLADELIEVLWNAMRRVWPDLRRPTSTGRVELSCDVDWLYDAAAMRPAAMIRRLGSLARSGDWGAAVEASRDLARRCAGGSRACPSRRGLERLMHDAERRDLRGVFNFIPTTTDPDRDGDNRPGDPAVATLLSEIHRRDHEIGVHPGYASAEHPDVIADGVATFRRRLAELGIEQGRLSSRQHFLRWCPHRTAAGLDAAGVDVDTTLGFADRPGFRCGTSHEFTMYDCVGRRPLRLRQRPLVAMEWSYLSPEHLAFEPGRRMATALCELRRRCLHYGGTFTLLWHNSMLFSPRLRSTLHAALDGVVP